MSLRTVLVVAYFFPPHRGIGGKRIARLVRRLPRLGWRPLVLTAPMPAFDDLDLSLSFDYEPALRQSLQRTPSFMGKVMLQRLERANES